MLSSAESRRTDPFAAPRPMPAGQFAALLSADPETRKGL
jgi:hypothetical protein